MILGDKTTGWPVPGVNFGGRQVFIQIKPGDKEEDLAKYSAIMCCALKTFAELLAAPATNHHRMEVINRWLKIWESTGIDATHVVERNYDPMLKRNL